MNGLECIGERRIQRPAGICLTVNVESRLPYFMLTVSLLTTIESSLSTSLVVNLRDSDEVSRR